MFHSKKDELSDRNFDEHFVSILVFSKTGPDLQLEIWPLFYIFCLSSGLCIVYIKSNDRLT